MSKYTMYYTNKQKQYREFATAWARFAADADLTETQRKGIALFFYSIAKRFGLVQDFKDIGVI